MSTVPITPTLLRTWRTIVRMTLANKPDHRPPGVRELCRELNLTSGTVHEQIKRLELGGYVVKVNGRYAAMVSAPMHSEGTINANTGAVTWGDPEPIELNRYELLKS